MNPESNIDAEFVTLLTDHQSVIRGFVISLLPGAPDLDDVIQKTNLVLWNKRGDFEMGSNFCAWALTVARFQVLAHQQALRKRHWMTLDDDVASMLAEDFAGNIGRDFYNERVDALRTCLGEARESDRELLMARYWRKTRLQDFAVTHGRSLSGLRVQLFRLRAALKVCIENRLGGEGAA
ncbi:DNA-directed RNA polymerase sigma-70 factor [Haloferula helveola]|uniref:DNA-directed RNA polymerase sigma-70 factor n=1 Tax=Haloferula helveola TaxID=490095 RepID=A0ABM7RJI0_9BACT|nr:DNA-directed RNA polymerase sigma-70 factor [Haloferula helveola]